jgi:hypothetical protein
MHDQLKAKIKAEIDRGIASESQVVYLLVEIRKLLDRDRTSTQPYNSLRFYSDWAVHVGLAGPQAQDIVKRADAFYPRLMDGTATAQEKADFAKIFSLKAFREEIDRFLKDYVQRSFSDPAWNSFLTHFLRVIEDCPLICKADNASLTNVDEVFIVRNSDDTEGIHDDSEPAIVWGLCFKGELKMPMGTNFTLSDKLIETLIAFTESQKAKAISSSNQ